MIQLLMKFLTSGAVAAAPATAVDAAPGNLALPVQTDLFPELTARKPKIPVGAIVMDRACRARPWYYHVRQITTDLELLKRQVADYTKDEKKRAKELEKRLADIRAFDALCEKNGHPREDLGAYRYALEAIPYGLHINFYYHGLQYDHHEKEMVDTGLRWPVPSHDELDRWCIKAHPWPPGRKSQFGGEGAGGYTRWFLATYHSPINGFNSTPIPKEQRQEYHYDDRPFPQEKGLLSLLDSLDPKIYPRWNTMPVNDAERSGYFRRILNNARGGKA